MRDSLKDDSSRVPRFPGAAVEQPLMAGAVSVNTAVHAMRPPTRPMGLIPAFLASLLTHVAVISLIAIVVMILQFLGLLHIALFEPLQLKERDLEFVLVENPPAPPRDPSTKNRAATASRSGGEKTLERTKAEPIRKAGNPQPQAKPTPKSPPKAATKPTPRQRQPRQTQPKQIAKASPRVTPSPVPTQTQSTPAPPAPKLPTPTVKPKATSPTLPPSPLGSIKTPPAPSPKIASSGPVMSTPLPSSGTSGSGRSGSGSPGPSQIPGAVSVRPNVSGGSGGGGGGLQGSGGRGSYDQYGSPGGGGGRPGIDALPEPDTGPWMDDLKRRIKRNWRPPTAQEDKVVVLFFNVGKDGRLLKVSVKKTSGSPEADNAAINAVRLSAPFRPLPAGYRESTADVEFTFDYYVYKATLR